MMGISKQEFDFPRGGASVDPSHGKKSKVSNGCISTHAKNQLFGVSKKRKAGSTTSVVADTPSKKRKVEGASIWTRAVTQKYLKDGVMGLGVVVEIYEECVLLETAYSCRVKLPATQISTIFTDLLRSQQISLDSTFIVGQMVPFRVMKEVEEKRNPSDNGKALENLPIVSCDPSKLNAHLTTSTLFQGLVLHAIVSSHEEKGAILDIGVPCVQGFLPIKKQKYDIKVGQPVLVRVDSLSTSRVVIVDSFVEQGNLSLEACANLQLSHLMPGTIIECQPDVKPSASSGVFVTLGNAVRGFVARNHLPAHLRLDLAKVGKILRCVVMFCQQNNSLLVLSAHPDVLAISKPERRASFLGYSIGDTISCKVIYVIPSTPLVCFSLPETNGEKIPTLVAVSYKKYLRKVDQLESFYPIGSEHKCRIISLRYADRCLVVSTRVDIIKHKFVSFKDAVPGDLVSAKITKIHGRGAQVTINETVKGFIPLDHISDKKIAIEKVFTIGKHVKCRVWSVSERMKRVWLSARPSLVNYKGCLISSYNSDNEGVVTVGVVTKILETDAAIIQFFGNVRGLLVASEAKRMASEIK
ncbi:S1 RNA binding domain protein [Dictyocaulus viviparus]|uniref:S1 RNA binding domain protein n=1 Tax=Dictyocaulus viviparus TaxID=29172 RepID=A0A0D8YAB7_DICVI|nr:S1 RNA binding domain protein [Dictyocaulus viviparus]